MSEQTADDVAPEVPGILRAGTGKQARHTRTIFTIGHSNHPLEHFLALLVTHHIAVLVDARSRPYSSYTPHFEQAALRAAATGAGLKYLFLGKELGGRPDGDEFYDAAGHVLYGRVAQSELFLAGITRLLTGIERFRVAVLCSEEDPSSCHRRLLVTRVLVEQGVAVVHIRGDGRLQTEAELLAQEAHTRPSDQLALFELPAPEKEWKSVRAVRSAQ